MARMLSAFLYKAGIQEYWDGNYQSSASLQARAETLNPENEDAGQCFRHAMEKLKTQSPSPLSDAEREWLMHRYNPTPMKTGKLYLTKPVIIDRGRRKGAHLRKRSSIQD